MYHISRIYGSSEELVECRKKVVSLQYERVEKKKRG